MGANLAQLLAGLIGPQSQGPVQTQQPGNVPQQPQFGGGGVGLPGAGLPGGGLPGGGLLGAAPQVQVPQQQFNSKSQLRALATLLAINPQAGAAALGLKQQNTQNIQRAQATNVGLRQQRESQIAQLEQRQREFDASTEATRLDRELRNKAEERMEGLAKTSNDLRREQIRVSKEGQNQFSKSKNAASKIAFGGFTGELGALTGEAASASGKSGKLLADDMMTAWREAGGDRTPSEALDAAFNVFDQGVERGQLLATTIGMLPDDVTRAIELLEAKMGKQVEIFNKKLTAASKKFSIGKAKQIKRTAANRARFGLPRDINR